MGDLPETKPPPDLKGTIMRRTVTALTIATLSCLAAGSVETAYAQAAPVNGSMAVSASVSVSCTVSTSDGLTFNQLDGVAAANDGGVIFIDCTRQFPGGSLKINLSSNANGDIRRMKHETQDSYIIYQIFEGTSAVGSQITTGNDTFTLDASTVSTTKTHTFNVYGSVVNSTVGTAAAGDYADTIPVTFTY